MLALLLGLSTHGQWYLQNVNIFALNKIKAWDAPVTPMRLTALEERGRSCDMMFTEILWFKIRIAIYVIRHYPTHATTLPVILSHILRIVWIVIPQRVARRIRRTPESSGFILIQIMLFAYCCGAAIKYITACLVLFNFRKGAKQHSWVLYANYPMPVAAFLLTPIYEIQQKTESVHVVAIAVPTTCYPLYYEQLAVWETILSIFHLFATRLQ